MRPVANSRLADFRFLVPLLLALAAPGTVPARAQNGDPASGNTEEIGSWLLGCTADRMTDRTDCRLLHRRPVEPASVGRAALALEVAQRGGLAVPMVTARNLTVEGAASGLLALTGTAQLRFPPQRVFEMPCGLEGRSVVCAPRTEDAKRAAEELAGADRVLVRVSGLMDADASRAEPAELPLSRTAEALARLRARSPDGGPPLPPAGLDLRDLLGRLMRFFAP